MKVYRDIFDFDGTLADEEAIQDALFEGFAEGLSDLLDLPRELVAQKLKETVKILENGKISDYILTDKITGHTQSRYLLIEVATDMLLDMVRIGIIKSGKRLKEDNWPYIVEVFRQVQDYIKPPFRDDAKDVLTALLKEDIVYMITNSRTKTVRERLKELELNTLDLKEEKLAPEELARLGNTIIVIGGAEKWTAEKGSRPKYRRALEKAGYTEGADPKIFAVVGDVYPWDLELPQELGMYCLLFETGLTPQQYKDLVMGLDNADLINSLSEIPRKLKIYREQLQ
jgi:FMN phosphatase YigB (HAD superfamily)